MVGLIQFKGTGPGQVKSSSRKAHAKVLQSHIDVRAVRKSGSGLELLFAVTIWLTLVSIALMNYMIPVQKASYTAMWSWVDLAKKEIALYYAEHGRWPNTDDLLADGRPINELAAFGLQSVQIRDGSFNLVLGHSLSDASSVGNQASQWNLSFRRYRQVSGAPVNWSCGRAETGYPIEAPPDLTNLDSALQPRVCRN